MVFHKTAKQIIAVLLLAVALRFYQLGTNPPSLYWEETALGYDAYSILKTGKDFHGNSWPLAAFESFGDYKPSLYFYATVPSVAIFGLTPLAVRFPSALFGVLTVWLVYLLIKDKRVGVIAAALLAISPWHLQLSRVGFEANLGLFLVVLGALLWQKGKYLLSLPVWALSLYAYHANRVFVPLLGAVWLLLNFRKVWRSKFKFLVGVGIALAILLPLLISLRNPEITKRFQETSALASLEPIETSNRLIAEDGNTWWARLWHHRFWQYKAIVVDNYLDHFEFDFLFLKGDNNPRHSIQTVGGLFLIQLPLLFFGLRRRWPWLVWLLLAPLPAAITLATPHALRTVAMVIPLTIFSAYGLTKLSKKFLIIAMFVLAMEFSRYLVSYYRDYPKNYSSQWQYGYEQIVEEVKSRQDQYDQIFITLALGRPSIYYWFFTQTDPQLVQAVNNEVNKDQGEYLEFGKIQFGSVPAEVPANSLLVLGEKEAAPAESKLVKEIYDLSGKISFRIYEI